MAFLRFSVLLSFLSVAYFSFMGIAAHSKIDFSGQQFIIELFTIPMLILLPLPIYYAIRYYYVSTFLARVSIILTAISVTILFKIALT